MQISECRLLALLALLIATGCHRGTAPAGQSSGSDMKASVAAATPDPDAIECQPAGAAAFARVCHVERQATPGGTLLTISDPSGSFRRLLVLSGGRGMVAADGAQRTILTATGPAEIEVTLAGDRFRLPAKLPTR